MKIQTADGQVQEMSPGQLQTFDPGLYELYTKNIAQPTAQLQETQAATGAQGASAARSMAEIPGIQANVKVEQAGADQLDVLQKSGTFFSQKKNQMNNGFVSPQNYNTYKSQYVGLGGYATTFDKTYGDNYVDPNNVSYDTPDAKMAKSTLPVIKNIIDSYRSLVSPGPEQQAIANLPIIGPLLKQRFFQSNEAHNSFLLGQAGNIRSIAGAGAGQGFRFNLQELNNIIGLLPEGYDTKEVASQKLSRLDSFMQSKMGVGLENLYNGQYGK